MTWPTSIRDVILERIANGESVREICRSEGMPSMSAVFRWLQEDKAFQEQYAHAKEVGAEVLADELLDIADDGRNDWIERNDKDNPGYVFNGEAARRSQIRIDARKWLLGKLKPKVYGEKLDLNHSGSLKFEKIEAVVVDPKG